MISYSDVINSTGRKVILCYAPKYTGQKNKRMVLVLFQTFNKQIDLDPKIQDALIKNKLIKKTIKPWRQI